MALTKWLTLSFPSSATNGTNAIGVRKLTLSRRVIHVGYPQNATAYLTQRAKVSLS